MRRAQLARLVAVGAVVLAGVVAAGPAPATVPHFFTVNPLVSNGGVSAPTTDAHLKNAWGLVAGPGTPWWVSDNAVDLQTLYTANGTKRPLEVTVDGGPTGNVFAGISG